MATDDEAGLLVEQIAKGTEVLSGAAEALLFVLNRRTAELSELKKRLESGGNIPALLKERDELVSCVENLKSRLESVAPEKVREVSSPGELLRVAADVAESFPLADPGREESLGREIARAVDSHIAAYPVLGPLRLALLSLLSAAVRKEFRAKRRHHIRRADYERAVEFIRRYALPKPDEIGEPALELLRIRAKLGLSAKDAAERIGVFPGTVLSWERGEKRPDSRRSALLQKFLEEMSRKTAAALPDRGKVVAAKRR